MIHPAPTDLLDPSLARGVYAGEIAATATRPAAIKLTFHNTNYEVHLRYAGEQAALPEIGKRVIGTIKVQARRIDTVGAGGQYLEPVYGRPRRVQGTVIAIKGDAVVIQAGVPMHCTPTAPGQKASDFNIGDFVTCAVLDGASFTQQ